LQISFCTSIEREEGEDISEFLGWAKAITSEDVFKGRLRLLDDSDVEAILNKNVVNALPARTVRPGTVNQHNIADSTLWILR
jgi:hypothetical protein